MESEQLNHLEQNVIKLKAEVLNLETKVKELKDSDNSIINKLELVNQELVLLKVSIYKDIANLTNELLVVTTDIKQIKEEALNTTISVSKIEQKLDKVNNNSLLTFTSEIDIKKLLSILFIFITISSSSTLISNLLLNNANEEINIQQTEKLKEVLDLLKELE